MKTPRPDYLCLAADWLESNDGDESPILREVADFLRCKAEQANETKAIRSAANKLGVSPARVREKLKQKQMPVAEPDPYLELIDRRHIEREKES